MSAYFGALLRSSGALPADVGARAMRMGGGDLVEQEVEVESGGAPAYRVVAQIPEAPEQFEPAPQTPAEAAPQADMKPREVARREPTLPPVARLALDRDMHSAVRAALQWVAADPVAVIHVMPELTEMQSASDPSPRRLVPHEATSPAPTVGAQPIRALSRVEPEAGLSQEIPTSAAQTLPSPAREMELTLPGAPGARLPAAATAEPNTPAPQDHIEVSIGTIHVAVDAPPTPRVVTPPAPPPQRPQTTRPTLLSGFARSRLPRI